MPDDSGAQHARESRPRTASGRTIPSLHQPRNAARGSLRPATSRTIRSTSGATRTARRRRPRSWSARPRRRPAPRQEEDVPPTARAAEQQPERQDHEWHEHHRERRPETVPVRRIEPDRRDRVRAGGDQARAGAPERRRRRVHAQHRQRGDDDEADRQRPRRDAVEQEEAAVDRPDRGRVGEDPVVLARERIVDQQVTLRRHLVGVQEVVAPVRSTRLERVRDVPGRGERERDDPREGEQREQLAATRRRPIASARPRARVDATATGTTKAATTSGIETLPSGTPRSRGGREQRRERPEAQRGRDGDLHRERAELGRQVRQQDEPAGGDEERRRAG